MTPSNPSSSPNPPFPSNPGDSSAFDSSASDTGAASKAEQLKQTAASAAGDLKTKAASLADEARHKVADVTADLKHRAADVAGEQKEQVANRIGGYSSAIREAGESIEGEDPNIAWVSQQAADRLQGVADYVRQRDFHGLKTDAESFARRHPAVLLGGAFFAGVLIGSVLRAGRAALKAGDENESMANRYDYEYDPEATTGEPMVSTTPVVPEASDI